jgi:hypothetical protein
MRRVLSVCCLVLALLALTGCGSGKGGADAQPTKDSSGTPTINITLKNGTVTPDGVEVKVEAGKPIKLHITADKAGELHVHSSPEQHIEFDKGTTDKTLTIKQPGVVDVEDHEMDKLIVQLQVS